MREVAGSNLPAPSRHLYIGREKHRAESVSLFQSLLPRGSADSGGEGPVVVEAALSSRRRTASAGRYRRYERQRYGHLWIEAARYVSRDDVDGQDLVVEVRENALAFKSRVKWKSMFSGDGVKQLINRLLPPRCVVRTSADNPIRESLLSHLFTLPQPSSWP